ncbi:Uma2 family endonuclease [Spirulina sp. CS-785/01]|uniref:Uma2 family endonuclease n=1 Tax=Spirulina sp. CS-785/01 TaxID=3021716 RepID=UPI00232C1322|nr:Uma2 family endonuclease [Spirulina sp. CS-785/01]MDB9311687.1 Uma2 family endonuclease [Spirulina sp. CS-785/01]
MQTAPLPLAEQRVLLENVSWPTFEQLLADLGNQRGTRLAYDTGYLEIMTPLGPHENNNRFMESLIGVVAEELNLNLKKFGSLTLKRGDLFKGAEPDSCYYVQHEPQVRHQQSIDLDCDPPPDLVLEIDMSNSSLDKQAIYAALGVLELWRYDGSRLQVWVLQPDTTYQQVSQSPTFPRFPLERIPQFIQQSLQEGEMATLRAFREWVRSQFQI